MSLHKLIYVLIAVAVALGLALAFRESPVAVELGQVKRAAMQVAVDAEGQTRLQERFIVTATVSGLLDRLNLDVGDSVAKAQNLARIRAMPATLLDARDRAQAQAAVAAAEAAVNAAREAVSAADVESEFAEREYDRIAALAKRSLVSAEALDAAAVKKTAAGIAAKTAMQRLDQAREELKAALAVLGNNNGFGVAGEAVALASPSDGVILKRYRESAGFVAAGDPLFEVGDPRKLEVVTDVLSADAVRLRPGMRALFRRWGGEPDLEGRVRLIEPEGFTKVSTLGVEEQRVRVIADIDSPAEQWAALGDRYRVESSFVIWESEDVLQVPANAVFQSGQGQAVFLMVSGRAQERQVKVGKSDGLSIEVLEGLGEEDAVILHPGRSVVKGVRVAAIE